ncbi:two pore domain potassium channel family protein [Ornithinimicrobium sediminis]|uniref:two pore domain potassium channel family protein n=1 Tax=Ornithinimicrobium sediminis TaxID=2904603 RepID=UPI001E5E7B14|nr:two pore domain potassium channel family protein [Ornithinimicrobium sediminis]
MFTYAGAAGRNRAQRWWAALREHPSAVLLGAQLLALLVFPYTSSSGVGRTVVSVFGVVVLALAVAAVDRTPSTRIVAMGLGAPVFVLAVAQAIWPDRYWVSLLHYASHAVFYFYTAISLLRYMFADRWVSRDELFATGATFTVLVWAYAHTYGLVQTIWPGSFTVEGGHEQLVWYELLFLSTTTLTGTGLSDIGPAAGANPARSVIMIQMLNQVFYIALVIARLLGLTLVKFRR